MREIAPINPTEMQTLLQAQQGELNAALMYLALADRVKSGRDAETFRRLAAEEGHHASVFRNLTQRSLKPQKTLATLLPILYKLLGKKLLYPIIAKAEYAAVKTYAPVAQRFGEVESVKNDEKRHGDTVLELLKREGEV